ncbi:uncharacterized protein SAPINGB_P004024 [Magnusiomyces paraingens]|uniref:Mnd1 HTH domain-containing protein n=1 Tax=Magnusiomyces paraingens TaxID=2606893 RepID=A0A5E8BZT1_9ASCO|nr:uncharacterized protein SAPINGB_P004024 [Saprochaete ingens]VVT54335.1 unnamed protein product [Saprochaete ingens]
MQIKIVLKALTDNSLVRTEKIGSSNYYWSFPSDASVALKHRIDKLTLSAETLEHEVITLQNQMDLEEKQRIPSEKREEQLAILKQLETDLTETTKKLEIYSLTSPKAYKELVSKIEEKKAISNKMTDNINSMVSYLRKTSFVPLELIQAEFGFDDNDMEELV